MQEIFCCLAILFRQSLDSNVPDQGFLLCIQQPTSSSSLQKKHLCAYTYMCSSSATPSRREEISDMPQNHLCIITFTYRHHALDTGGGTMTMAGGVEGRGWRKTCNIHNNAGPPNSTRQEQHIAWDSCIYNMPMHQIWHLQTYSNLWTLCQETVLYCNHICNTLALCHQFPWPNRIVWTFPARCGNENSWPQKLHTFETFETVSKSLRGQGAKPSLMAPQRQGRFFLAASWRFVLCKLLTGSQLHVKMLGEALAMAFQGRKGYTGKAQECRDWVENHRQQKVASETQIWRFCELPIVPTEAAAVPCSSSRRPLAGTCSLCCRRPRITKGKFICCASVVFYISLMWVARAVMWLYDADIKIEKLGCKIQWSNSILHRSFGLTMFH